MRITNLRIEKEQILLQTLLGIAAVLLLAFGVSSLYTAWDGAPSRVQPDLNSVAITEAAVQGEQSVVEERVPEKTVAEETRQSVSAGEAAPVSAAEGGIAADQPAEMQPAQEQPREEQPAGEQPAAAAATA